MSHDVLQCAHDAHRDQRMSGPHVEGPLPTPPTISISIRFPEDELEDIDRQAEAEFRTRSQLIRLAVARYINEVAPDPDKDTS